VAAPGTYRNAIATWPPEERPRERLLRDGPQALQTGDLLAILLRTGVRGRSAVDLAREILGRAGGRLREVEGVLAAGGIKGLGPAKVAQLRAALELGRRALGEARRARGAIRSARDVYELVAPQVRDLDQEVFLGIFLTGANEVLAVERLSEGSVTETAVYVRRVMERANHHRAAALICAHNHPSGSARPSPGDREVTEELVFAGRLMRVPVLDHVIVGDEKFHSFADEGFIAQCESAYEARRRSRR
jgi:DNA repair protein RadC